jgi:hypothetical protein
MKLTTEQIEKINHTLNDKGLVYEDIKFELIDHIATDIELEKEGSSFEAAFSKALHKWESVLKKKSSVWSSDLLPIIFVAKYTSLYTKQFKLSFLYVIVFSVLMTTITILIPSEFSYNSLRSIFASVFFALILALLIISVFIWKSKSKTTYGRFFKKNCILFGFYFYIISKIYNKYSHLYKEYDKWSLLGKFSEWFGSGFLFFMGIYLIQIAFKHYKTLKKHQLT